MHVHKFIFTTICILLRFYKNYGATADDQLVKEIDLFSEVGLLSKPFTGVTRTTGVHDKSSAFHFTTGTKHLIANSKAFHEANKLIHNSHDFILTAYAKIDANAKYAKNSILSITSPAGRTVYLRLDISGDRRGTHVNIDFAIQVNGGMLQRFTGSSSRNKDYKQWHKITVRVQDTENLLRILVDDKMAAVHKFNHQLDKFPADAQLRLAQVFEVLLEDTGEIADRFRGDLQDVKFLLGSSTECSKPKPCQCSDVARTKSCVFDGYKYEDGNHWTKNKCIRCQCKNGQVMCIHSCPVCKDNAQTYLHGESWNPVNNSCLNCRCEEGNKICTPPPCPKPDCSGKSGDVVTPPGQCCPVCKEDQCRGTGKVYKTCGCPATCSNYQSSPGQQSCNKCTEGCFCAHGKVLNEHGKCVSSASCPCVHKGRKYKAGEIDLRDCIFCLCLGGQMSCSGMCQ